MAPGIILTQQFRDWEWYGEPGTAMLFVHLLLTACAAGRSFRCTPLKRGELVTTASRLAVETGLSAAVVRTGLKRLTRTGHIATRRVKGLTFITVNNYDDYGRWLD